MSVRSFFTIKYILWLLVFLLLFQQLQAQSYTVNIQKLSVEDGLSNRFVRSIYKDSRGFIWIGTPNGLNRYDGYTFKQYTKSNSNLISNNITSIQEDDQQRLWIIHSNDYKTSVLDLKTDSIRSFSEAFKESIPFGTDAIRHINFNARKGVWITTKKGTVYRFRENRSELIFTLTEKLSGRPIRIDDQFLWLIKNNQVLKVNLQSKVTEEIDFPDTTRARILGFDKDQSLWFVANRQKKLVKVDKAHNRQSFSLKPLALPEYIYQDLVRYYINRLNPYDGSLWWYNKRNEALFYAVYPKENVIVDLQTELEPFFSYGFPSVKSIYFTAENRAIVGTEDGAFIITLKKNKFTNLLSEKSETNSTRSIIEDEQGNLYINTINVRVRIDKENRKTVQGNGRTIWWGSGKDKEGNLWFGRVGAQIEKYDPLTQQSRYYNRVTPADKTYNRLPFSFLQDKTGRMWIGFDRGLCFVIPGESRHREFTGYNGFERLKNSGIYHLYEDEKGIWIAANSGLYLMEPEKGITRRYASDESPPYRLPYDKLYHFYKDKEGMLWLATGGGGLIRFNPKDGSFRQFTVTEGLSSNTVYAVYEDDYNRLWLPSEYGLMVFDKTSFEVRTYLKNDGISHNEFNRISHYRGYDGRLYFGGLTGVTVVDPDKFTVETPVPAPIRIISCRILNGQTGALTDKTATVQSSETLELSPSDRSLIMDFALLNYENSRENSYLYKIEGLDKTWTKIENNNNLRLNNLPYGNHIIHIKGKDIKGVESANILAIAVLVNKPFYRKNGFIAGCILALGFLIYGIFRWRVQRLKQAKNKLEQTVRQRTQEILQQKDKIEQQAEKLRELDGVKSRFFANISHELRTPLTLILGPLNSLITTMKTTKSTDSKDITKPLKVMQRNGKKLLQLIEEILDLSKLEARKLEIKERPVAFYTFIKRLFVTFESHAVSRNIRYELSYEPDKEIRLLLDSDKAEKIITNFLSNAFKYSPDEASISLRITDENNFIRVVVHDTGPGIHPDDLPYVFDRFYQSRQPNAPVQGGTGIGLALCKELVTLMGGDVHVESRLGEGTVFSCTWPKKEIEAPDTKLPQEKEPVSEIEPEALHDEDVTETSATDGSAGNSEEKPMVLVVEDHKDMRDFIVEILRDHYQVQTAGDGEKALARLKEKESLPDMVLSDVMMPNMDGFTLLKTIKSNPLWRNIPTVLLTARAAQEDRLQALSIGVDDYLTKPFNAPELLARIRNLLNNYREREQWQKKEDTETTLAGDFGEKPESWDAKWVQQAREIVKREVVNHNYKVSDLAAEMLISESQLLVKMKQITGLTPNEFIREIKLQKARVLLENKAKSTVAEVAYTAGFNTPGYFSTVYEKRFGKRPTAYLADY